MAELLALGTDSPDGRLTAAEYELNCGDPQRAVEYMRDVDALHGHPGFEELRRSYGD